MGELHVPVGRRGDVGGPDKNLLTLPAPLPQALHDRRHEGRSDPFPHFLSRLDSAELRKELPHLQDDLIRRELPRKMKSLRHPLLLPGKMHGFPEHLGPPGLLLGEDSHALVLHLLAGHPAADSKELLRAFSSKRFKMRPLGQLLLVDAVLDPEPEVRVVLVRAAGPPVALEDFADLLLVEPLPGKSDDHIKIIVGLPGRMKGHEVRLKIIASGCVPYAVSCASCISRILLLDHIVYRSNMSAAVRSAGILAAITSEIRVRS